MFLIRIIFPSIIVYKSLFVVIGFHYFSQSRFINLPETQKERKKRGSCVANAESGQQENAQFHSGRQPGTIPPPPPPSPPPPLNKWNKHEADGQVSGTVTVCLLLCLLHVVSCGGVLPWPASLFNTYHFLCLLIPGTCLCISACVLFSILSSWRGCG